MQFGGFWILDWRDRELLAALKTPGASYQRAKFLKTQHKTSGVWAGRAIATDYTQTLKP